MTQDEFRKLPGLIRDGDVARLGYTRSTLLKLVDCGGGSAGDGAGVRAGAVFETAVRATAEVGHGGGRGGLVAGTAVAGGEGGARRWTGFAGHTLARIVAAGGLTRVRPPGAAQGRYLKAEVGRLIGVE